VIYNFCHVFTSEVLFLVTGAIGLVTSIKFGWNIMLMNTRYIIGIGIVHYILTFHVKIYCYMFYIHQRNQGGAPGAPPPSNGRGLMNVYAQNAKLSQLFLRSLRLRLI